MKPRTLLGTILTPFPIVALLAVLTGGPNARQIRAANEVQRVATGEFKVSGPYSHRNLTIFLVHGHDSIEDKKLLTLQEALEQKLAIVHETDNVTQLSIENISKDAEIFIQSGDIVKGGKQDRLISFSMIVPAQSGKVALAAFCVEQGRWHQRGKEVARLFDSSMAQLPSKALKVNGGAYAQLGGNQGLQGGGVGGLQGGGCLGLGGGNLGFNGGQLGFGGGGLGLGGGLGFGGNQGGVWTGVSELQTKLVKNAGADVRAKESPSSLQLTLENDKVKQAVEEYIGKLSPIVESQKDALGYAFAINGKVNSVEVYGSAALFKKLWPKLLRATATEALAEVEKGKQFMAATEKAVMTCIDDAYRDRIDRDLVLLQKTLTKRVIVRVQETDQTIFVETRDRTHKDAWIHRTYFTK
jgi:hypothetical protein